MVHLGDICKISGYDVPITDIVCGGSPCQDLSVAGKRAGLAGERSGLFMEQMRIVKEMRQKDEWFNGRTGTDIRPRYMVWENVPGAFSSGTPKGADFQAVLEEVVRVICKEAPAVPIPAKGWPYAGCLSGVGDGGVPFTVAWRVHDAQFWGVAQRRRRISLVADFGGMSAPEILFEREGVSRDSEPGGEERQGTPARTKDGSGSTICLQGNGIDRADTAGCNGRGWCEDVSYTLNTIDRPAVYPPVANTLSARHDGSPQPDKGNGANIVAFAQNTRDEVRDLHDVAGCLAAETGMKQQTYVAGFDGSMGAKAGNIGYEEEVSPTLNAGKEMHVLDSKSAEPAKEFDWL